MLGSKAGLPSVGDAYDIFGCRCVPLQVADADACLERIFKLEDGGYTVAINFEKIMMAYKSPSFRDVVDAALLPYPDGVGAVFPLRILEQVACDRIDLPKRVIETCWREGASLMLIGGPDGVAEEAAKQLEQQYPGLQLSEGCSGFKGQAAYTVLIQKYMPDVVLLGVGSPYQEFLAKELSEQCGALIVPCGGALEVIAKRKERAPETWRRLNMEWLWRVCCEPSRLRRLRSAPLYCLLIIRRYLSLRLGIRHEK